MGRTQKYVCDKYGHADILVNNAGCGVKIADVTEQSQKTIDSAIAINLNGLYTAQRYSAR